MRYRQRAELAFCKNIQFNHRRRLEMNKRILVAAVILGLAVMACGFGGTAPTATPAIVRLPPTAIPPVVQPTQAAVQPTQAVVQPTQAVVQPTQPSGSSSSGLPFSDDFTDSTTGWEAGSYSDGTVGYGNGYYFVKVNVKGDNLYGAAAADGISDVAISVDGAQFDAPSDNNTSYGVICRLQNDSSNDGYYFKISGDGDFSATLYDNGSFTSLLAGTDEWQASPSVNQGNVSNHFDVSCNGDHLTFKINGKVLYDGTDQTFSSGGFGLVGAVYDDAATAEFHFTSFQAKAP
jgi:hypothetical protein